MERNMIVHDDQPIQVVSYKDEVERVVDRSVDYSELQELAERAQRLIVSRLGKAHVKGGMEVGNLTSDGRRTNEKMFAVEKLVEWQEGDPTQLVDLLRAGRLRCRLSARMGIGKSIYLPSYLAHQLNMRVCHVALDAHALQQVVDRVREKGIGKYKRRWSVKGGESVSCMTYADFNGYMATDRRVELFKSFDIFIFDEAFHTSLDVFVAKRCFSAFSLCDTSLILCSATIRTDKSGESGASASLGRFKELEPAVSIETAIASGKLYSEYLVDKTMVLMPDNKNIYQLQDAYESVGVDVRILDDAASLEQQKEVLQWLRGDTTVPRVLVAHIAYGIGFNFPISYVIVDPREAYNLVEEDYIYTRYRYLSEEMVTQAKSRTGRGMTQGSGGIVMSTQRATVVELAEADKIKAFVKLCAASILPLNNEFWKIAYDKFPEGLTAATARLILKVCIPPELAFRYISRDAKFAGRYCRALAVFCQPDHFIVPSKYDLPNNHHLWQEEKAIGVKSECDVMVVVPMHAEDEMQVVIHAIEAMASGHIDVTRWRSEVRLVLDDGYDSPVEGSSANLRVVQTGLKLRRIENSTKPLPSLPSNEKKALPWKYRDEAGDYSERSGGVLDSERFKDALRALEGSLEAYIKPAGRIDEVVEEDAGSVVPIVKGFGDVESPGGSVVCSIPVAICERMNMGKPLSPTQMVTVLVQARKVKDRFAASKLFDAYSGPWDSFLMSLMNGDVLDELIKRGLHVDTYAIVSLLNGRFGLELCSVLAQSNTYKRTFLRVFSYVPSMNKVMAAITNGRFDGVAQTDGFISRVKEIKYMIDSVLLEAETKAVYLPVHITEAQRSLPLRGKNLLGYVGDGLAPMPKAWSDKIDKVNRSAKDTVNFGLSNRNV